jgi:antitoxin MazE
VKTRLVRIGNSRGVRIPKPLIEQAGLREDVELRVAEDSIVISCPERPRHGWAEAAARMAAKGEDELLDTLTPTRFDEEEWKW